MPPVKISIRLEIDENISFMDGHYLMKKDLRNGQFFKLLDTIGMTQIYQAG